MWVNHHWRWQQRWSCLTLYRVHQFSEKQSGTSSYISGRWIRRPKAMSNPEPMIISSRCISSTLLRLVTGFFLVMTASAFHRISSHRNLQLRHPGESSHHKKAVSDFSGGSIFPILSQAPASTEVKNQNPISLKDLVQSTRPATGNNIVIIAGFEAFNVQLYRKAAALVT